MLNSDLSSQMDLAGGSPWSAASSGFRRGNAEGNAGLYGTRFVPAISPIHRDSVARPHGASETADGVSPLAAWNAVKQVLSPLFGFGAVAQLPQGA